MPRKCSGKQKDKRENVILQDPKDLPIGIIAMLKTILKAVKLYPKNMQKYVKYDRK